VQEQYFWSPFLVRWFWLILFSLALLLQYRLWFGEPSLPQVWNLKDQIEEQKRHNQVLLERNTQLEAEVRDLKQGLSALEERARSEMGMIVKGETFFQVVKPLSPAGKVNE
jgi:cell division protein FtsB